MLWHPWPGPASAVVGEVDRAARLPGAPVLRETMRTNNGRPALERWCLTRGEGGIHGRISRGRGGHQGGCRGEALGAVTKSGLRWCMLTEWRQGRHGPGSEIQRGPMTRGATASTSMVTRAVQIEDRVASVTGGSGLRQGIGVLRQGTWQRRGRVKWEARPWLRAPCFLQVQREGRELNPSDGLTNTRRSGAMAALVMTRREVRKERGRKKRKEGRQGARPAWQSWSWSAGVEATGDGGMSMSSGRRGIEWSSGSGAGWPGVEDEVDRWLLWEEMRRGSGRIPRERVVEIGRAHV